MSNARKHVNSNTRYLNRTAMSSVTFARSQCVHRSGIEIGKYITGSGGEGDTC